ncbi:MAG: prephenate dehydrogenase/arogenate dehydrogenase family protein [Gallionellaceae bacterium]|nr:prephenate dehydrogenase/arogenate dehydrogenase family protein [Gallionellaceae bacterium]
MIKHLVVIGTGLIGGSFALAMKRKGLVERVTGIGRGRANLEHALKLGVIDAIGEDVSTVVKDADLVLAAIPVGAMPGLFRELAEALPAGAILTDAGSTKRDVIAAARAALGDKISQFVPGHPIAGAETNGAGAAHAHLFEGKPVILTPLPENRAADVDLVESLWTACSARVARMSDNDHDRVFAAVSHLPHLAAFALMEELADRPDADTFFRFAGTGFRDFSRIAGSHPEMWRDIALANREALLGELDTYIDKLESIRGLIESRDGEALEALFARARQARTNWIKGKYA